MRKRPPFPPVAEKEVPLQEIWSGFEFVPGLFGIVLRGGYLCGACTRTVQILIEFQFIVPELWQLVVFCTCRILPEGQKFCENFPLWDDWRLFCEKTAGNGGLFIMTTHVRLFLMTTGGSCLGSHCWWLNIICTFCGILNIQDCFVVFWGSVREYRFPQPPRFFLDWNAQFLSHDPFRFDVWFLIKVLALFDLPHNCLFLNQTTPHYNWRFLEQMIKSRGFPPRKLHGRWWIIFPLDHGCMKQSSEEYAVRWKRRAEDMTMEVDHEWLTAGGGGGKSAGLNVLTKLLLSIFSIRPQSRKIEISEISPRQKCVI